jgi:hypothetical protein
MLASNKPKLVAQSTGAAYDCIMGYILYIFDYYTVYLNLIAENINIVKTR